MNGTSSINLKVLSSYMETDEIAQKIGYLYRRERTAWRNYTNARGANPTSYLTPSQKFLREVWLQLAIQLEDLLEKLEDHITQDMYDTIHPETQK